MATKFRFTKDWDYQVRDKKTGALIQTFAYRKGEYDSILEAHAEAAVAAGAGERVSEGKAAKAEKPDNAAGR